MLKRDDAAPDHSLPLFLSDRAAKAVQRTSTRTLKAGLLLLAVLGGGAATLVLGDPLTRLAATKAALFRTPAQVLDNDQAGPPPQLPAEAQTGPPAETETPTDRAATAPPAPADQAHAGPGYNSDVLFKQFQEWAAREASKPDSETAFVPDGPSPIAQDEPGQPARLPRAAHAMQTMRIQVEPYAAAPVGQPPARALQKQRPVRELPNARAEIDPAQRARPKALQAHGAPTRSLSPQDGRTQETPAAGAQQQSLRQLFGVHN
jgi:hypothetical protein